jgi:hypothetical protein
MMQNYAANSLITRMQRAAMLDRALYNEVEQDPGATNQAFQVALIAGVASGLGTLIGWLFEGRGGAGVGQLIGDTLSTLINWFVWSYVTYFIGTRLFEGRATPGELLRTLGFALTPYVLSVLGFVPAIGGFLRIAVFWWVLVAGVVAVREALDVSWGAAIGTVIIGAVCMIFVYFVQWVIFSIIGLPFRVL